MVRPKDLIPEPLFSELLRLGRLDKNWVAYKELSEETYQGKYLSYLCQDTWLPLGESADRDTAFALSRWLVDGPKIFIPTKEQCAALENIEVNLAVEEYAQPYPAILVEVDCPPFSSVLNLHENGKLISVVYSPLHSTTTFAFRGIVEDILRLHNDAHSKETDISACRESSLKARRIACNACLALTHYGCLVDYLFPKEVESDKRLSREASDRGDRARQRLSLAVQRVSFSQEIKLHRTSRSTAEPGAPTGQSMPCHWRRGHWAMQACGVGRSERKRILRKPVLVRPDLFIGDVADTEAVYVG